MKNYSTLIMALPLMLASCGVTRIVTVAPEPTPVQTVVVAQPAQPQVVYTTPVSTTVTYPRTRTTRTTTIEVNPMTSDISLYLDLQAVAAAFGQASSVEEFEMILNSSSYIISNLDLNHDGYIDYLRVLETIEGRNHVLLIQAVLAANIYQDVATLVVEMGYTTPYVQIIGAPYIYGVNYIIEPVYYARPPLFDRYGRPNYAYWRSPYYWDHFPHHYGHHAPYHLGHYQAYVHTYMEHHHYCHTVHYVDHYHYAHYEDVSRPMSRNDYGQQYPEQSFSCRTTATYVPQGSSTPTRVTNARHLQQAVEQSGSSRTTTSTRSTTSTKATTAEPARTQQSTSSRTTSSQSAQPATSSRTSQTATSSRSTQSTQAASQPTPQRTQSVQPAQNTQPAQTSTSQRTQTTTTQRTQSTATQPQQQTKQTTTATTTKTAPTKSVQPTRTPAVTSQPAKTTQPARATTTTNVRKSGTTTTKSTPATSTRSSSSSSSTRSSSSSTTSRSTSGSTSSRSTNATNNNERTTSTRR